MRISDWSSDVCSSDLRTTEHEADDVLDLAEAAIIAEPELRRLKLLDAAVEAQAAIVRLVEVALVCIEHRHCVRRVCGGADIELAGALRSEEHTPELQSLMRISYAVFCLDKTSCHIHTAHTTTPAIYHTPTTTLLT